MPTKEGSFREKLGRAKFLVNTISEFENYAPTRPEDQIAGMTSFVEELVTINDKVATLKDSKKSLTDDRRKAFLEDEDSLLQLIIQIKAAVESQYGRKSSEAIMINRNIALMRSVKPKKSAKEPKPEGEGSSYNRSEKSYGSMANVLNDIISSLSNYPDFATSNERVKVDALKATSAKLDNFNAQIAKSELEVDFAADQRVALYTELKARTQRIKTYVKGQYGHTSREYLSIKGLRF